MSDSFDSGLRYASRSQGLWALVAESLLAWEERVNQGAAVAGLRLGARADRP